MDPPPALQKKGNIVKYTTFCTGIDGDGASKSKKKFKILLANYIRSVLWREAVRLSYIYIGCMVPKG